MEDLTAFRATHDRFDIAARGEQGARVQGGMGVWGT